MGIVSGVTEQVSAWAAGTDKVARPNSARAMAMKNRGEFMMARFILMASRIGKKNGRLHHQFENNLNGDGKDDDGKEDFQLIAMELTTQHGADLGAEHGTHQENNGQNEINRVIGVGLEIGNLNAGKKNLEQA